MSCWSAVDRRRSRGRLAFWRASCPPRAWPADCRRWSRAGISRIGRACSTWPPWPQSTAAPRTLCPVSCWSVMAHLWLFAAALAAASAARRRVAMMLLLLLLWRVWLAARARRLWPRRRVRSAWARSCGAGRRSRASRRSWWTWGWHCTPGSSRRSSSSTCWRCSARRGRCVWLVGLCCSWAMSSSAAAASSASWAGSRWTTIRTRRFVASSALVPFVYGKRKSYRCAYVCTCTRKKAAALVVQPTFVRLVMNSCWIDFFLCRWPDMCWS